MAVANPLGGDIRFCRTIGGAEHAGEGCQPVETRCVPRAFQPVGLIDVGRRALPEDRNEGRPIGDRNQRPVEQLPVDAFDRFLGADAERLRKVRHRAVDAAAMLEPIGDPALLADCLRQRLLERKVARQRDDRRQRLPCRAAGIGSGRQQNAHADVFQHLLLLGLFQHLKAGGDVGFERKLLQQPRAESVDGLHLQAAGGFQRLGEQLARLRPALLVDPPDAHAADFCIEGFIIERGPAGKAVEHPVRHGWRRRPSYR